MAKVGNALMLAAIFATQYVTEPMFVMVGLFVIGFLLYLLDR